jgi:SAM-dependent methyltransferase
MTQVGRRAVGPEETSRASRAGWDAYADDYQSEHGAYLGGPDGVRFLWGPEGLDEAEARLLGPSGLWTGARALEIGGGAAQCARWLARSEGVHVVSFDISGAQIAHARRLQREHPVEPPVLLLEADAGRLPFRDTTFDLVFSAHGGIAFHQDVSALLADTARILKPGGRMVVSVPHPIRWMLPDDPGEEGLRIIRSYFDSLPYVEQDDQGRATYVEHHHTVQDLFNGVIQAGLHIDLVHEVRWPEGNERVWGGWGPVSGRMVPRTLILGASKPVMS